MRIPVAFIVGKYGVKMIPNPGFCESSQLVCPVSSINNDETTIEGGGTSRALLCFDWGSVVFLV